MSTQESIILAQDDFIKISSLVKTAPPEIADLLEEELERATIVADDQVPQNVVAMNSTVRFVDLETGKESTVTLVYPPEANVAENKVSVLAPIGSALIGLRVGQEIEWPFPQGKAKKIRVTNVMS